MYDGKKIAAIIMAGGRGTRMGGPIPKQFIKIGNTTILEKAVQVFLSSEHIDSVVLVLPAGNEEYWYEWVDIRKLELLGGLAVKSGSGERIITCGGGPTRQASVYQGLMALPPDIDYVLIHDGSRPYVTQDIVIANMKEVLKTGACTTAVPVKDTIRGEKTLDRETLFFVQTPQSFEKNLIIEAHKKAIAEGFVGTDDGVLVERLGKEVTIVEGSYENIKITTRDDLPPSVGEYRTGIGFDVHAFTPDRKLILGGVEVPYHQGLLGHSDADVLTHAVMDALLGAAGLGDIGQIFPDRDPAYKGISSLKLLAEVKNMIKTKGYSIVNIDVTLILQEPKIAPYRFTMVQALSRCLDLPQSRINIKATTSEKMGYTGRGEGVSCQAVAVLYG